MAGHDLPIWIHPHRGDRVTDYAAEEKSKLEIWHVFGWPYETTAAMTRIVFSGLFDRHPNLKIITHHLGAMVPFFEARIRGAYDQFGTRTPDEDYAALAKSLRKHPYDYYKMFYADTALYGGPAALEGGRMCRQTPQRKAGVWTGASHSWTSSSSRRRSVTENPAISRLVMYGPTRLRAIEMPWPPRIRATLLKAP